MAIAEAADVDRKADVATATIKRTFIFGINENSRVGVSDSAIFLLCELKDVLSNPSVYCENTSPIRALRGRGGHCVFPISPASQP